VRTPKEHALVLRRSCTRQARSPGLRLCARQSIGFIGGLTTYSSFNYETTRLMEEGATGAAVLNATSTILGAFAAGWLGMVCAR
jgi:fluoride ion exporter CrcB/FEX